MSFRLSIFAFLLSGVACTSVPASDFFDLGAKDIDGAEFAFEQLRGSSAVVITNVASYCGNTDSGYAEFKTLSNAESMTGLHIIAFPCNQFGEQEPDAPSEIKAFATNRGVNSDRFHLLERVDVNGERTHPVYAFLKKATDDRAIEWNFATAFVVHCDDSTCHISRHDDMSIIQALKQAKPPQIFKKKKKRDNPDL